MIDYRIDRSQGIVFTKVFGSTSVEEVAAHIQFAFDDPHFQPNFHIIAEIEKDTKIDARLPEKHETLQDLLINYGKNRNGSKCAVVIDNQATREIIEFGLSLIEYISHDVQIFGNKDEALEWIKVFE